MEEMDQRCAFVPLSVLEAAVPLGVRRQGWLRQGRPWAVSMATDVSLGEGCDPFGSLR